VSLVIGGNAPAIVPANGSGIMAASKLVGGFGDSRIALSFANTSGLYDMLRNLGLVHWTQAWSRGVITMPKSLNGGIAGNTTIEALARLQAYITLCQSLGCRRVLVCLGTNDRPGGIDLGTTKKNVREIIRRFITAGIVPYLVSETPRGTGSSQYELSTQALRDDHYNFHMWCENTMSKMCKVINAWDRWIDPASGIMYYPKPGMTIDGIHGSKVGGNEIGQAAAPVISADIAQLPDFLESNVVFNATTNPLGSLVNNPLLDGITGTWQGSFVPVAGSQLATGWNCSVSKFAGTNADGSTYALTIKASKEVTTDADGVSTTWQRLDVVGNSGTDTPELNFNQQINFGALSTGDIVKATALVKTRGTGISNMGLTSLMTPIYQLKADAENSDASFPWPTELVGPVSREMPSYVKGASDNVTGIELKMNIQLMKNAAINASFWIAKCGSFKVTY
jgi:lysophospholipase L1-like esterase